MFSKPLVALMLLARCFSSSTEDQQQQCLLSEKPSDAMVVIEMKASYVDYKHNDEIFPYIQNEQVPFVDFHKTVSFAPTYFDTFSPLAQAIVDYEVLAKTFSNDQCSTGFTLLNIVGDETNTYSDPSQELSVIGWMIDVKSNQEFTAHVCPAVMNFGTCKNPLASFLEIAEHQKHAQKRLELDPH
jgi:hypothetical protein